MTKNNQIGVLQIGLLLVAVLLQLIVFSDGLNSTFNLDAKTFDIELVDESMSRSTSKDISKVLYKRFYFSNPIYFSYQLSYNFTLQIVEQYCAIQYFYATQNSNAYLSNLTSFPIKLPLSSSEELLS